MKRNVILCNSLSSSSIQKPKGLAALSIGCWVDFFFFKYSKIFYQKITLTIISIDLKNVMSIKHSKLLARHRGMCM